MTIRVSPRGGMRSTLPSVVAHYIGKPYIAGLAQAHIDELAHLLGFQLSTVANIVYGASESASDTWRIAYQAGANVRAVAVCHVPYGSTGSAPTIAVSGAETETPVGVAHTAASVTDLGDIPHPGRYQFVVPVTAGALQELAWTTVNTRLHSTHIWEVPRGELMTTENHVDRTFADAGAYITDDVSASDPRGFTELLNAILSARTDMRRHIINLPFRPGLTSAGSASPTFDYLIGSATHNIRVFVRSVAGGSATTLPVRAKVRVSAISAGTTHTVRLAFGTGGNLDITGINATGWWPGGAIGTAGTAGTVNVVQDTLTVQASNTGVPAGTITIDSICVYEDT